MTPPANNPKVSVCVVTHNQENYIQQCLQSIIDQQTNFDFEIIVGDDDSTDQTRAIVANFAAQHPNKLFPIFHGSRVGALQNYIEVHNAARGKYIAHLDGDDYALPNKLQLQADFLDANPECNVVWHRMKILNDATGYFTDDDIDSRLVDCRFISRSDLLAIGGSVGAHSAKMYRSTCRSFDHPPEGFFDFYAHVMHIGEMCAAIIPDFLGVYRKDIGMSKSSNIHSLKLSHYHYFLKKYPQERRSIHRAATRFLIKDLFRQRRQLLSTASLWFRSFSLAAYIDELIYRLSLPLGLKSPLPIDRHVNPQRLSKKLVYILNSYSENEPTHFGHVLNLLEAIAARGISIVLIIEKAKTVPQSRNLNLRIIALHNQAGWRRFAELFCLLTCLVRQGHLKSFIRITAPAALIAALVHRVFGGAAFLWQSGTTLEYDASQPPSLRKAKWLITSHLPNRAARYFTQHFVTGPEFMIDYYVRVGRVDRKKIRLLYNDIDVSRFSPPKDRQDRKTAFLAQHGFLPETLVLLLVHRLSPVRRTQLYFPACLTQLNKLGLLQQIVVVVAGDGPELPAIKAEAALAGVAEHCLFLGSVPNRKIEELYGIADIFLHPTYNEGFPRVILEAMAAGLPIVSTDAGGTRELLGERQVGLIVPRDAPQAFADCLAALITDPPLRQQLAEENRQQVERFSTDRVAEMYEKILFT